MFGYVNKIVANWKSWRKSWLSDNKVCYVDALASEFGMRNGEAVDRINRLMEMEQVSVVNHIESWRTNGKTGNKLQNILPLLHQLIVYFRWLNTRLISFRNSLTKFSQMIKGRIKNSESVRALVRLYHLPLDIDRSFLMGVRKTLETSLTFPGQFRLL